MGSSPAGLPARQNGAYFLPMTYESDCAACHALDFDPRSPDEQVRHGTTPQALLSQLRRFYEAQASRDDPELLGRFLPERRVPGQKPDGPHLRVSDAIEDKVQKALSVLLGQNARGCIKCHALDPAMVPPGQPLAIAQTQVVPVNVPAIWFAHARFDHRAHRALNCAACHRDVEGSRDHLDVLIPGIAECLNCHGSAKSSALVLAAGGAGSSCTDCHRYHNGDQPMQGLGASARGVPPSGRFSFEQFQRGDKSPSARAK
jgi:hypothetical protein